MAAFYPAAFAAQHVVPDGARVFDLTPVGAEPHDLELTAADLQAVLAADLVIYVGGMQPSLTEALAARRGPVLDLLTVPGLDLLRAGNGGSPGSVDPHFWLDPRRYARAARAIARHLGDERRADSLVQELEGLDAELERGLTHCARRELVATHAAFGYIADRYGLEQVSISGLRPEAEPAPRDLAKLIASARAAETKAVFVEPLLSRSTAEVVAREIGASVIELDPLEVLAGEHASQDSTYFEVMRANLDALRQGLECSE